MRIPIDRQSNQPLYRQIESYLRQGILSGSLAPGTRLPASRQLAKTLGINRITVETAYAELESDGLVYSQVGSGTYVLPPPVLPPLPKSDPASPWPLWQKELSERRNGWKSDTPEEHLRASGHKDPINFALGIGDYHAFPAEDFRKIFQSILRQDGASALGYGDHRGFPPLRSTITHVLASQGVQTTPEQILITSGSQQGLSLVSQLLLKPGDAVLVEDPTYSGALNIFRAFGAWIVGLPLDHGEVSIKELEKLLQQYHPKLLYTIPNFHNPTGACMDLYTRRKLIALADLYNVPILEDDFVGDLRYDGRAQPALKALDPGGRVIYTSTFSKMVMPGLRVGFLVADGPVNEALVMLKRTIDLSTSSLIQRALEAYVTVGRYQAHLQRSCRTYRKRRDAMLLAIERYLPDDIRTDPPQGGLFIWLQLPEGISSERLLPTACQNGVAFSPGTHFFINGRDGDRYMRLNFAAYPVEEIEVGIKRLARAMKMSS